MLAVFSNTYIDGLAQDCGNSSALALELPQSCTKPSIYETPGQDEFNFEVLDCF